MHYDILACIYKKNIKLAAISSFFGWLITPLESEALFLCLFFFLFYSFSSVLAPVHTACQRNLKRSFISTRDPSRERSLLNFENRA